ncbi:FAD-dependent oxidoreductase [Micromonospora sp. NBC_01655]|nr:hypothetical protein [Micromonospora sp. NBC_01655]MCX4472681.1 FAD-dependent oxidoreductase [Micromonospora sp. NBC_01655]
MSRTGRTNEEHTDVLVVGGGVVVVEPCTWIGGQLTSQAVSPDEHR